MVFLDSGFLIALANEKDEHREEALLWNGIVVNEHQLLLTTEYCLLEVVDALSQRGHRSEARELVEDLRRGKNVEIIPCSTLLFDRGLALHAERDDKTWSLTDCITCVVMEDRKISDILAFDHDFVQARLRVLPLEGK